MGFNLAIIPEQLLIEVYKDLAQPSVQAVGKALGSVFGLLNTAVLPIDMLNTVSKERTANWLRRYSEKIDQIEENKLIEVPAGFGVPIVHQLAITTSEELQELYINLLASASSTDTIHLAQPGFVHIVSSLSVDEARIIQFLFKNRRKRIPYIYFSGVWVVNPITKEESSLEREDIRRTGIESDVELIYPQNAHLYMSNLIGLGMLETWDNFFELDDADLYQKLVTLYESEKDKYRNDFIERRKTQFERLRVPTLNGYYKITDYGHAFIFACHGEVNF